MYDTATILVIFGSVLFVLAIFGGGVTVKEIKVPPIQSRARILLYPVSIAFIIGGVWLSRQPPPASVIPTEQPTSQVEAITPQPSLETKTRTSDPFGCKVWNDDFSQTSGWGDGESDWGGWHHENGEFKMNLYGSHLLALKCNLCNDLYQQDFHISVTARTSQQKGSWGIYFWDKDKKRYSLELDENGSALIKQYDDYDFTVLDSQSANLLTSNHVAVEYLDGNLSGYVNGERLLNVSIASPPTIGTYGVGLIQLSLSSDSAEVFFDDFSFSGCP